MTQPNPPNQVPSSQAEYDHILSYFKYLVTLTTIFVGFLITGGVYLFHSNMKEVKEDAKQEATRVATSEVKTRVTEAFDEKNINASILAAAQQKVGTITDKLIEQQLAVKLRPIQQRILLIGQISESETRMRLGFRSGLEDLNNLIKRTNDTDVIKCSNSTLAITGEHFEFRLQEATKQIGQKGMPFLQSFLLRQGRPQQSVPFNLHDVVQMIYHDPDLNCVAAAFVAFRDLTSSDAKMFDIGAIRIWCSQNQSKCQIP